MNVILIAKVKEPYGWMGNMSPYPIVYNGENFKTSEALFQCLRFEDKKIVDLIKDQSSPMAAKMIAKKYKSKMVVEPLSEKDLENMRLVIEIKLEQHPILKQMLLETKESFIVEDCTRRKRGSGLFWGAALQNNEWIGCNWLGKIWMEYRKKIGK